MVDGYRRAYGNGDHIIKAFESNKTIQNYCKHNDVFVEMTTNQLLPDKDGHIKRFAAVHIKKIFPQEKGFFKRLMSIFSKKPREEFYISAYSDQSYYAELKLASEINSVQNEKDLMKYLNRKIDIPAITQK